MLADIGTKGFQQAIRSATATYPIPFMVGILLLFALFCLGGAIMSDGFLRVVAAAVMVLVIVALAGLAYTLLVRHHTKNARMLITEVNLGDSEGWLPDKSWDWVRKRSGTHADTVPA